MENATWIYLTYIILYKSQTHKNGHCMIPFTEWSKADLKSYGFFLGSRIEEVFFGSGNSLLPCLGGGYSGIFT